MPDDEARPDEAAADAACLVPLSAHTPEQLRAAAGRLAAHLGDAERERRPLPLRDLAYTLQTGRDELPVRLALVVRSTAELAAALTEFSEHGGAGPGRYADLTSTSTSTSTSTGTGTRPAAGGVAGDPRGGPCLADRSECPVGRAVRRAPAAPRQSADVPVRATRPLV